MGFPGLSSIDAKTVSTDYQSLEVSFLKWNQQMIGDTPPDQYVHVFYTNLYSRYSRYQIIFKFLRVGFVVSNLLKCNILMKSV